MTQSLPLRYISRHVESEGKKYGADYLYDYDTLGESWVHSLHTVNARADEDFQLRYVHTSSHRILFFSL